MGVVEQLEKYMVEQTKLSLDAQRAKTLEQIGKTALPLKAREAMEAEGAGGGSQGNPQNPSGGDSGRLPDMMPMTSNVDGGDRSTGPAIQSVGPSQPPQTVPTPAEEQRPGYVATTRAHRMGVMFPWQRAKYKNMTSYDKDEASVNTHATSIAAAYDSVQSGNAKSGDEYNSAVKSARAELGPFAAEAVAEGKAMAVSLNRTRMIGEAKAQKEFQMGLVEQGAPPEVVAKFGKAYSEGPEELARVAQASGWKPKTTDAEYYAAETTRQKLLKLERENRVGGREEAEALRVRYMQVQRDGLSYGAGYRLSEEEAGWTRVQVHDRLAKILAGGVDAEVAGALPSVQKAGLVLNDEATFAKDGNILTGDTSHTLRGKDIVNAFTEAGGGRPRKAPVTAGEKKRGYGGEAFDQNDVDPNATMAFREDRAQWLVDNIPGLEGYDPIPSGDGQVRFGWKEEQGNRNVPFIMFIQDIVKVRERMEEQSGRQLNTFEFGNKARINEARGKRNIPADEPATSTKPQVESPEEKAAVKSLGAGASKVEIAGAREGARMVSQMERAGKFVGAGLMEIPRTLQQTGQGLIDLGKGAVEATKDAAVRKAARDKAFIDTLRNRKK